MKSEYSFEHFQKRREEIRKKNSRTKQTILRLFLTTFSIVLFSFLVLASIMSPNLNIPALNDDTSVDDMSSSDFKSRVDYRLKQIQMDDGTSKPSTSQEPAQENGKLQNMISGAQKMQENIIRVDLSTFETPQLPNKPYPMQSPTFKNDPAIAEQYAPPKPKALATQTQPQAQQQPVPPPYVPKTPQQNYSNSKSYKILVGNYSSPDEAQGLSDMFSANSAGKTHIKSYNGIYCVQIGSYSDFTKAQNIANAYRAKNYKVRVVEE
ncbi:MAG: SPOR domain-containing protein [bacterium]